LAYAGPQLANNKNTNMLLVNLLDINLLLPNIVEYG
jgi:hypothetical protein